MSIFLKREVLLVKFPIIFPLVYLFILYTFPIYETHLIFLTIFNNTLKNKQNYFFNNKPINFKRSPWPRSQDLNPLISLPFAISILRRKNMIRWGSCVGEKPYFIF